MVDVANRGGENQPLATGDFERPEEVRQLGAGQRQKLTRTQVEFCGQATLNRSSDAVQVAGQQALHLVEPLS